MWKAPLPGQSFNTLRIANSTMVGTKQWVVEKGSIPALHNVRIANSTLPFAFSAAALGAQEMDLTLNDLRGVPFGANTMVAAARHWEHSTPLHSALQKEPFFPVRIC